MAAPQASSRLEMLQDLSRQTQGQRRPEELRNRKEMHIRSQQLGARPGVSMDMKTSWAAQEYDSTFPNLETMARFQQKQLQEKEQKLLQLYDQQQQRAYQVVQRGSAGSNGSHHGSTAVRTTTTTTSSSSSHSTSTSQGGKVRQMFDERRQTTVKGIDRSYPLEPLENKLRKQANGVAPQRNGNVTVNRQSVKRVTRADVNSNVNGGKPVVSYHEEIIRDSFGPSVRRHDDEDEYGVENRVATFANGYHRHEIDNEQEEAFDQDTIERNRMMAKIHLMGFDETLKHRVRNDLDSEEFPEYLMTDVPDKLSKRNVTKKLSQAEERLERFKNANAKRGNVPKQSGTVIRKRPEQTTKSNSRLRSAGTSPTSTRSESSRISERSQRILENAKSLDTEMLSQRTNPRSFSTREAIKTETTSKFYPRNNEFKSLTSDGKLIVRRSASPQFFCRESERSATTMSIDRKSGSSGSPLFHREMLTKRNRSPRFFLNEYEQSRRTSESKSPIWGDTGILSKPSTSPQYYDSKRSETAMSSDRETTGSKAWSKGILTKRDMTDFKQKKVRTSTSFDRQSPPFKSSQYEDNILKRRSTSPQFFCKESERSATTMSIDRATNESESSSYDREIITKRGASPRFFLNKSDRETVGPKASEWRKEILTKRGMTDFEQKKVRTSTSFDRQSPAFKSSQYEDNILKRRSISPQFFCKESERSATTMSIDRATSESKSPSYDREIITKRGASPRFFLNKSDRETVGSKASEWNKGILTKRGMTDFEQKKIETSINIDKQSSPFKSSLYEDELLKKRSTSPQFFCKESERSATTMSIDRATSESKSPSYDREIMTKRGASSPFFLSESKQARRTSKSPIWSDVSSKQSTSMQYFLHKPKQFETAMSIDREIVGSKSSEWSKGILTKRDMTDIEQKKIQTNTGLNRQTSPVKSPLYEDKILKRRSTSPQFFCRESERSATTMSIDRPTSGSKSPSQDRETLTRRGASPPFFFSESEQSRRTSESKSSIRSDRGILSRQSTSPRYREFKRSETAMSTDRETIESKSSERSKRNTRPRFFYNSLGRSGTTMSTGRKICEPKSSPYDRKILTKRSSSPLFNGKTEQRSAIARSVDRKNDGFKLSGITRDKRSTSPQFFCKESERSATTMLIESRSRHTRRTDSTKNVLKQRDSISDTSYRRSVKSPIDRKVISTKYRYTPSPPTRHEVKRVSGKNEFSKNITEARRSSRISETSATSASSIVNLKYGLELDNIFQSTGLVRKFMKSQNGKQRATRQSPSKRNITEVNARIAARGNQSKNRRKTSPLLQTTRSPSIEDRKRATPEFSRKTITPTEVDMDIQEITMTDHRIERDKLQKASSPISKRQFDGAYAKSSGSRAKFKTSITYPVHKMRRQSESILESSAFKGGPFKKRSAQEGEESVISKFSPASESSLVTRGGREKNRMFFQTQKQSARNQAKYNATQSMKYEDRQRASSRSPNQMWTRSAKSRTGNPRAISPKNTASPILYNFAERTKGACTKFDQPRSLRSTRLVQDAAKDRNLSTDDEYSRGREGDKNKDIGVDEVDAGIGVKCQTIVETALDEKIKDQRKIARPNSADRIANRKVFLRETTQKPMKSSTSKKTISPTRDCGRRHDVKFRVSPRVSPLRKTAEISRDAYTPKIFLSRSIVSKADQSSTPKSSAVKDRKYESVLVAKRLAESFDKMKVKCKTEESEDSVEEFTKVLRENKYEKNLERMDSVESALRRFDSIGAEFERSSPTNLRASPEISLQTIDIQTEASKQSIVPEGTTIPSREVTDHTILRSMLKSPIGKDLKAKNAAYKSDLRIHQKKTRSFKRPMKVESFIESKQRTTKIRSPTCKRRLFESDSEKEIQEEWLKSNRIKARKDENCPFVNFRFRKDEAVSNVRSKDFHLDITRESMRSEETLVKPLRSIEDIRKSIENERNKLITVEESRSAIANRRSASRDGVDAKKSSPATNAARNVFLGADPARAIKIRSCVSRITKSPSPDSAAIKQRETNARTTKGSNPSSPSKSPEVAARRTDLRNQEAKPSKRSTVAKGMDSTGSKMTTAGAVDTTDGALQNGSPSEFTTRKSDAFTMDFDDRPSKEDDAMPLKKSSMKKSNDKQQTASSASGRPTSSSNSSVNLIQDSSAKGRMAENERGKGTGKGGGKSKGKGIEKPSSSSGKLTNASSFNEDATTDTKGLVKCKTCGRSFASNRIDRHEEICTKTTTKKRKQFDPVLSRVKGTELEPFVKKSISKRETKTKKPETKPDWRRKHEEFINTIRYARETQARLAAGENLSDLPPPPTSDTSDYIQCEHCGRKFNQSAAERHIPICKRMHNKKQTPKARR